MNIANEISDLLKTQGAFDHGFADFSARDGSGACGGVDAGLKHLTTAVSVVVRLSNAVVDEIVTEPTMSYFHHYRTVNTAIDQMLLKLGMLLQNHGFRYIPIPASQSIPTNELPFSGRFSHKEAAVAAGLGCIGKNCLFMHRTAGCNVRLGTLFTDWKPAENRALCMPLRLSEKCADCNQCIEACPADALIGRHAESASRDALLLPEKCSRYMKEKFQHIGRGAVCGLCMSHCPQFVQTSCLTIL